MQRATRSHRLGFALLATVGLAAAVLMMSGLAPAVASTRSQSRTTTTTAAARMAGEFVGSLGPLRLKLHLHATADGTLSGTLDSLDQGATGIPCSDFQVAGSKLSFAVPSVRGRWSGTIENGGATLDGTWNQGRPLPLTFTRDPIVMAGKPSRVDGFWLGTLGSGAQTMRMQVSVKSDAAGREFCAVDNLDLGFSGVQCAQADLTGSNFAFELPGAYARWSGTLSNDGRSLTGTWSRQGGGASPLNFEREAVLQRVKPPQSTYDPAMAPVDAASMHAVLDRDLAGALKSGALSPGTSAGVAIGVIENGVRRVFAYGTAKPGSIFEIGSITKTFTGLLLAQLIEQGKVRLDEPVRELLPPGTATKPPGPEITLLDLVTQHSGLPRMPDNFHPADPDNPYVDYRAADLYEYLRKRGLGKPPNAGFLYSNLGLGLLGQALANRARTSYARLVAEEITQPLRMSDTVVSFSPEQASRFIQGYTAEHRPAHAWDQAALAGAGALRSTAADMLTYLEANLHPERIEGRSGARATLAAALVLSQKLRADALPGMRIAFAWAYRTRSGTYWHNGGTAGYTAYAFFNPKADYAGVVLMNVGASGGDYADRLGEHIEQRFAGKPAVSLAR